MTQSNENIIKLGEHKRAYIRQYPVYDPAAIRNPEQIDETQHYKFQFIGTNIAGMNHLRYLESLIEYEAEHQIKSDKRKKRYGKVFDLLMPKGTWDDAVLLKVAKSFWKRLVQKETGLKFIAWRFYTGKATLIRIWIADRERYYTQHVEKPLHKRTDYMASGKFCSKTDPNAKLAWKKGSRTKKADEKKYTWWNSTKTRLFSPAGGIHELQEKLFECLEYALKQFNVDVIDGLLFRRRVMKQQYSRWVKRILADENGMMRYTEDRLNELYLEEKSKSPVSLKEMEALHADPQAVDEAYLKQNKKIRYLQYGDRVIRTERMNLIMTTYEKYKTIFKEGKYTDQEGVEHLIEGDRCDRTHSAILLLKKQIDEDIELLRLNLA